MNINININNPLKYLKRLLSIRLVFIDLYRNLKQELFVLEVSKDLRTV